MAHIEILLFSSRWLRTDMPMAVARAVTFAWKLEYEHGVPVRVVLA